MFNRTTKVALRPILDSRRRDLVQMTGHRQFLSTSYRIFLGGLSCPDKGRNQVPWRRPSAPWRPGVAGMSSHKITNQVPQKFQIAPATGRLRL